MKLERLARDKRSSLLHKSVNYDRNRFYDTRHRTEVTKFSKSQKITSVKSFIVQTLWCNVHKISVVKFMMNDNKLECLTSVSREPTQQIESETM